MKNTINLDRAPHFVLIDFACERETIRMARNAGKPAPWTKDPILRDNRFTNVVRLHDRVTQHVLNEWLLKKTDPWFWSMVCRKFNSVETLEKMLPATAKGWNPEKMKRVVTKIKESGKPVFGAAYLIACPGSGRGEKANAIIDELDGIWQDRATIRREIKKSLTMQNVTKVVSGCRGFGRFISYEVALDLMILPPHYQFSLAEAEDLFTWTQLGPGSTKGIRLLHGMDKITASEASAAFYDLYAAFCKEWSKRKLAKRFPEVGPITCDLVENILCECSKYIRISRGARGKRKFITPDPRQLSLPV